MTDADIMDYIREVMLDVFRDRIPDGGGDDGIDEPFTDAEYAAILSGLRAWKIITC